MSDMDGIFSNKCEKQNKLIWPTFLKFQFRYIKQDPEAIWTLRLGFASVPVTKQMFMFM